jgi:hypothetical protein
VTGGRESTLLTFDLSKILEFWDFDFDCLMMSERPLVSLQSQIGYLEHALVRATIIVILLFHACKHSIPFVKHYVLRTVLRTFT